MTTVSYPLRTPSAGVLIRPSVGVHSPPVREVAPDIRAAIDAFKARQ